MSTSHAPLWISIWFAVASAAVLWDAAYCFLRPRSMEGGDLHHLFPGYKTYAEVDHGFGWPAYHAGDGFPRASATMNLLESALQLGYLYLAHSARSPIAPLIGLLASTATLSKCLLYFAKEAFATPAFVSVRHNEWMPLVRNWVVPNGCWLVMSGWMVGRLGREVAGLLRREGGRRKKKERSRGEGACD